VAGRVEARGAPLKAIPAELADADVVDCSTGSQNFLGTKDMVGAALRRRKGRPLFFIALAVPRDLDPAIHELPGCYVYDIDDLEAVVSESLSGRRGEAARAEAIVAEEAERFHDWQSSLGVVPAIASLRAAAEEIRSRELARGESRVGRPARRARQAGESLAAEI